LKPNELTAVEWLREVWIMVSWGCNQLQGKQQSGNRAGFFFVCWKICCLYAWAGGNNRISN